MLQTDRFLPMTADRVLLNRPLAEGLMYWIDNTVIAYRLNGVMVVATNLSEKLETKRLNNLHGHGE